MTITSFLRSVMDQGSLLRHTVIVSALALTAAIGAEGPIAHWTFEERSGPVAADVSGNGHTGTLNGVYWHNDVANGAIYCDGSGHVAVQDAPSLRLKDALTLANWVRIADPTAAVSMRMISKKIAWDSPQGYEFEYNPANNVLGFTGPGRDLAYALVDLDTSWHHLAAVIDGPTVRLYVDGAPVPMQDDQIGALQAGPQPLTIGRHSAGGGQFDGAIDDVRLYRRALAAFEIRALLPQIDQGLVAHWNLDESVGTVANDRSANALHGVLTAGADWFSGPTSGAVYLDGAGHVAIPDSSKLRLTQALTIMAWARVADPQQASYQRLVSKKNQWDDADGYELIYHPANRLLILGAGGDDSAVAVVDLGSDWHQITATISGTAAQLYVDGKAVRMEDAVVGPLKGGRPHY